MFSRSISSYFQGVHCSKMQLFNFILPPLQLFSCYEHLPSSCYNSLVREFSLKPQIALYKLIGTGDLNEKCLF
jgi:hypothetical protein